MNFERANDERDLDRLIDRMCDQLASADELAALGRLLSEDPAARDHYIACLELHARLAWQMTPGRPFSSEELLRYTDEQAVRGKIGSEIPDLPIAIPSLSPLASPLSPSFVGGPVFSYMVATVVLALMLLGAWAYKISHVIPSSAGVAQKQSAPAPVFVGRITGMKDCRWAEADTRMIVGASVPLGREYALTSGLMEITYKSGARVILEGPCTYKVESSAGGFLAIGKLTANIRTQSSKPKAQSSEPSPLSSLPSPLFAVRTPTAIVTDLGTEFGVEVAKNGDTTSHVFKGSVQVQILPSPASGRRAGGEGGMVQLDTGESVLVKKGEDGPVVVRSGVGDGAARFTRRMPKTGAAKILISQNFDSHPFYDGFTFSTDSSRYSRTIGGAWRLHYLIGDSGASVANEFSYSGGHSVHVERLAGSTPRLSASTERLGAPIGAGRLVSSVRLRRGEYGGLVHGVGQNVEVESGHLAVDVASPAVVIQTDGTIKARRYDAAAKTWDYTDPLKDAGENLVAVPPRVWFGVKMEIDLDSLTYDVWYDAGSGYVLAASKLPTDGAPIDCMGFCIQGEQGGERRSEIWIDDVVLELDESGK